jgi:microcystin-dependent protein
MPSEIIGMINLFTSGFDPHNFRPCDGRGMSAADYPDLYAAIGTTYGGNSTTFNLPNLNTSLPFPGGKTPSYIICINGYFPGTKRDVQFLGIVKLYAGTPALTSYKHCNGQSLATEANAALYSIIGTTYGGNSQNFDLPNLNTPPPFPAAPDVKYVICTEGVYPARP